MISFSSTNSEGSPLHQKGNDKEKLPHTTGPQATGTGNSYSDEEPMNRVSVFRLFVSTTIATFLMAFLLVVEASCATPATPEQQALATSRLDALMTETSANPGIDRLIAFERSNPRTQAASLSKFLRGYQSFQRNDYAGAIDAFSAREIYTDTSLGDYALYYWGQSLQKTGKNDEAFRTFDRLVKEHPESLFFADARIKAAESLIAKNDANGAIKYVAEQAAANDPGALLVTAKAQEASGDQAAAIATYKKIYFETPATNESDAAEARLKALNVDLTTPFDALQGRAEKLYDGNYFGSAVATYEKVLALYADKIANTDKFNLHYGISLYSSSDFKNAVSILQGVGTKDPDMHAQSLYYIGESYRRLRLSAQFGSAVDQLLKQHPDNGLAPIALYNLGSYYEKNDSSAGTYYSRLLQKYPKAPNADVASFYLAWRTHQGRSFKLASEELLKHVADYPQSDNRSKAAFWAGFDAERSGSPELAMAIYQGIITRYEYSYYGFLAQKHLKDIQQAHPSMKPQTAVADSVLTRAIDNLKLSPAPIETATAALDPRIRKSEDLRQTGLFDLANGELDFARKLAATSPRVNLAAAKIMVAKNEPFLAITALKRGYPDYPYYKLEDIPQEVWNVFFPLRDWKTIKEEAAKYNMDPYFVAGIIRQETIFNPQAKSKANALGMMQLLYSTARPVAKKYGMDSLAVSDLYNPTINIKLGVALLAQLYSDYGKSEYVAAAYNAGPGRLSQWRRTLPTTSMEEWVESIPISETRLYIQGVTRNSAQYRRLYDEQGVSRVPVATKDNK